MSGARRLWRMRWSGWRPCNDPDTAAYRLRRRDYFENRWLRHAQISPWYVRLVRPELARYTREINEVLEIAGKVGELESALDHYPFSKGVGHWLRKHDLYSSMEARLIVEGQRTAEAIVARRPRRWRLPREAAAPEGALLPIPGRPLLKWLYMVFMRRAFLDGRPGLTYANLQAIYEYMIVLKTRELREQAALETRTRG